MQSDPEWWEKASGGRIELPGHSDGPPSPTYAQPSPVPPSAPPPGRQSVPPDPPQRRTLVLFTLALLVGATIVVLLINGTSNNDTSAETEIAGPGSLEDDEPEIEPDNEDVRQTEADVLAAFDDYRRALLTGDASTAVSHIAANFGPYFEELRQHALTSEETTVRGLPLMDQMGIIGMRIGIAPEVLRSTDGPSLVAIAIEEGLVGEAGTQSTRIEDVEIVGNNAYADIVGAGGLQMTFRLEDDAWKLDLIALSEATAPALQAVGVRQGLTQDELVDFLVTTQFGSAALDTAWSPVGA